MKNISSAINEDIKEFVKRQKIFLGTAAHDGLDTLRILEGKRVAWINPAGNGN